VTTSNGRVDAHVHLLPPRLARKVRAVFDTHLPGAVVYPLDPTPVLADLAAADITTAWSLPYAHAPGVADWLNPALREHVADLDGIAAAHEVTLVPGATVHAGDDDPAATVTTALDAGARVVKLHCAVGGFGVDDPRLDGMLRVCTERRVPVVVHAGRHPAGVHDGPGLAEVGRAATRHPALRLIVAHTALPDVAGVLALLDRHPQVHADLTPVLATTPALDDDQLTRYADRLLFGSDAPNTGASIPGLVARWSERDLATGTAEALLGGTARQLLADVRP
jgi:uncharacterized protein